MLERWDIGVVLLLSLAVLSHISRGLQTVDIDKFSVDDKTGAEGSNRTVDNPRHTPDRVKVRELWEQYKQEHSHEAIRREYKQTFSNHTNHGRKYAIGYYSCPHQAGNRLHHFYNSLIWAVVTNRTFLWKYYDRETCEKVGRNYGQSICKAANKERDCATTLNRASWLPSSDYWSSKLSLHDPFLISFWSTHKAIPNHKLWVKGASVEAGVADTTEQMFIDFPPMLGQDAKILHSDRGRKNLLNTTAAQERARILFQGGDDFLYGLLFFESFAFQPSASNSMHPPKSNDGRVFPIATTRAKDNSRILVLHSRHSQQHDNGTKIKREKKCLDRLLPNSNDLCKVIVLSDRPSTLDEVSLYLNESYPNCEVVIADHDIGRSFSPEHGPFAGPGFYQDLALVSNQTLRIPASIAAFIGSKRRSSSALVREIMTFQLNQQARNENQPPTLMTCYLEDM